MTKTCTAVLGEMGGRQVVCRGPVVEHIEPGKDAKCARCGAKYPAHHNYRRPRYVDAYSGKPISRSP